MLSIARDDATTVGASPGIAEPDDTRPFARAYEGELPVQYKIEPVDATRDPGPYLPRYSPAHFITITLPSLLMPYGLIPSTDSTPSGQA